MLSEYSRRVNTSAAFAQQDRGLQFLSGKRVFFTTVLTLVSCRHTSALVARCADFSLASHMPCWFSCSRYRSGSTRLKMMSLLTPRGSMRRSMSCDCLATSTFSSGCTSGFSLLTKATRRASHVTPGVCRQAHRCAS